MYFNIYSREICMFKSKSDDTIVFWRPLRSVILKEFRDELKKNVFFLLASVIIQGFYWRQKYISCNGQPSRKQHCELCQEITINQPHCWWCDVVCRAVCGGLTHAYVRKCSLVLSRKKFCRIHFYKLQYNIYFKYFLLISSPKTPIIVKLVNKYFLLLK